MAFQIRNPLAPAAKLGFAALFESILVRLDADANEAPRSENFLEQLSVEIHHGAHRIVVPIDALFRKTLGRALFPMEFFRRASPSALSARVPGCDQLPWIANQSCPAQLEKEIAQRWTHKNI